MARIPLHRAKKLRYDMKRGEGTGAPCLVCNEFIFDRNAYVEVWLLTTGHLATADETVSERDDQGLHRVGMTCAQKRIPREYWMHVVPKEGDR